MVGILDVRAPAELRAHGGGEQEVQTIGRARLDRVDVAVAQEEGQAAVLAEDDGSPSRGRAVCAADDDDQRGACREGDRGQRPPQAADESEGRECDVQHERRADDDREPARETSHGAVGDRAAPPRPLRQPERRHEEGEPGRLRHEVAGVHDV